MKYTLKEIQEILNKEIEDTQAGAMMLINDDLDNHGLYESFNGLTVTKENLDIIFGNLIEKENG